MVSVEWVGARNLVPALQGPVVDFRSFFSRRGIVLNYDLPGQPAGANAFGVDYQTGRPRSGRAAGRNVPASFSPAQAAAVHADDDLRGGEPDRVYDLYIYDSTNDGTTNYDRVLVVPATAVKDGAAAVADLAEGDWADVKVDAHRARGPARPPAST